MIAFLIAKKATCRYLKGVFLKTFLCDLCDSVVKKVVTSSLLIPSLIKITLDILWSSMLGYTKCCVFSAKKREIMER